MANSQHRCVFVGNIPYDATEEQLIQICEEVGPVVSFRLVLDRETGKPKGYGFSEYKDEETALSARRNLQGYEINGRQLRVDFAENDKNADRNKEQGRGGPGLIGNFDPQKTLASATFNQPIGLALAASAASTLAVALNNAQANSVGSVQNGFPIQLGVGSDPITLYLAKISRNQLHEILSEMQTLAKQNQPLARQVLLACPQLAKAIFQALIMLGMVPTQMLQIPNIRQTPATANTPSLNEGQFLSSRQIQQHRLQTGLQVGLTEKLQEVASLGQNSVVQSSLVQNTQGQTGPHVVSQTQIQIPVQLAQSGGTPLSVHPLTSLPVFRSQTPAASSIPLYQQIQPSLPPQQPRPVGYTLPVNVQSAVHGTVVVQPFSAHSISNQGPLKTATAIAAVQATDFRESGGSVPSISAMHSNFSSEVIDKRFSADTSDMPHPSKVSKLDGGTGPSSMMGAKILPGVPPLPASTAGTSSVAANQISKFNATPKTEQQVPQLSPEVESVLLQQVMNLTPEQLNSLPPEQRQQVLQLQQMLR